MTKVFTKEENDAWSQTLDGKMCSACLIVRHKNEVLMVKAKYKDYWTFFGGIVDRGESPQKAALREAREESGLEFASFDCQHFCTIYTHAREKTERDRFNFAFIVNIDRKINNLLIPNNEIEMSRWVATDQVAKMANYKASYAKFQDKLCGQLSGIAYIEV